MTMMSMAGGVTMLARLLQRSKMPPPEEVQPGWIRSGARKRFNALNFSGLALPVPWRSFAVEVCLIAHGATEPFVQRDG